MVASTVCASSAALSASRIFGLERRQTGALFACGSFTNLGSIGALICFLFLGEMGFALVPIYKLFEETVYYTIGFPVAKLYSTDTASKESLPERLVRLARDPFIIVALSAVTIGGILNLSGLHRPTFYATINAIFIPVGTILLLVSIGLAMRFSSVRHYLRECAAVSVIKFTLVPLTIASLALLLGYHTVDGGLPLKVVIILSSMPVAFNALIPQSIYDLDLDLANSCWLFTTSLLVVVLPVLRWVTNHI
jgi:hypothetical protein